MHQGNRSVMKQQPSCSWIKSASDVSVGSAAEEQNTPHYVFDHSHFTSLSFRCHKFNQTLDLMPVPTAMYLKSEGVHGNETNLLLL